MHKTAIGTDEFGKMREEGDHVVLGNGLDLVDTGGIELCGGTFFTDRIGCRLRNDSNGGKRVAGMGFDFELDAEAGFGRPDGDHFGPGITRDHRLSFSAAGSWCGFIKDLRQSQRLRRACRMLAAISRMRPKGR